MSKGGFGWHNGEINLPIIFFLISGAIQLESRNFCHDRVELNLSVNELNLKERIHESLAGSMPLQSTLGYDYLPSPPAVDMLPCNGGYLCFGGYPSRNDLLLRIFFKSGSNVKVSLRGMMTANGVWGPMKEMATSERERAGIGTRVEQYQIPKIWIQI